MPVQPIADGGIFDFTTFCRRTCFCNNRETTGNEVRSVETPVKEPDELESDSKQNEPESQQ